MAYDTKGQISVLGGRRNSQAYRSGFDCRIGAGWVSVMPITVEGDEKSDSVVDARKGFVGGRRNAPTQAKTGVEWATRAPTQAKTGVEWATRAPTQAKTGLEWATRHYPALLLIDL
jgi:hypothetical protein